MAALDQPRVYRELLCGKVKFEGQESVLAVIPQSDKRGCEFPSHESNQSFQAKDKLFLEKFVQGCEVIVHARKSKPLCVAGNKGIEELVSGSSKTVLCSAFEVPDLTDEHKKMIDQETRRFKLVGSQMLRNCFTADDQTAKIRLQMSLVDCFCELATIATSADPGHRHFAADLEHCVTSDSSKPHYLDITISQLPRSSDSNPRCTSQNEKLCIVVELMFSGLESRHKTKFQEAYSQLKQTAKLAFNAKQWDEQLCWCLGSLTHWHVFLLKVVRDPEKDCPFQISHYNEFALRKEPFDWDSCGSQFVNMYKTLFEHLLRCLLVGQSAASPAL